LLDGVKISIQLSIEFIRAPVHTTFPGFLSTHDPAFYVLKLRIPVSLFLNSGFSKIIAQYKAYASGSRKACLNVHI